MTMCSSSKIGVDGLRVGLDFVLKLVESFEGGLATDWSVFYLIKEDVLVIDITSHGGWRL